VSRHVNRSKAVNEIWEGFTQVFALRKFAKNPRKTMKQMNAIKDTILSSGCIIHLTTEKANEELTTNYIEKFIDKTHLRKPVAKPAILDKDFYEQTNLSKAPECSTEAFTLPSQVGFAARIFKASEFATNKEIAELVFAHWFSSSILWEQIRTIGGAYGSYALSSDDASFTLYTYRDPVPYKSLDAFTFCLKKACETNFDETTTQKAVTGAYSSMIQPKSPSSRGFTGLLRAIYGVSEDDREQRLKWLLALDGKALHDVAIRLFDNNSINENVIICSKVDTITGKINKIKV
jgi:Zn-dependent M16 (insulinase) family peptidase